MFYILDGVKFSLEKVRVIESLELFKDKKEFYIFLGMVIYMSLFIFNLVDYIVFLRNFLKENVDFIWNLLYLKVFEKVKVLICIIMILVYYDRNELVVFYVDVLIKGLGVVFF